MVSSMTYPVRSNGTKGISNMKSRYRNDGVKRGDVITSVIMVLGFLVVVASLILKLVGVLK